MPSFSSAWENATPTAENSNIRVNITSKVFDIDPTICFMYPLLSPSGFCAGCPVSSGRHSISYQLPLPGISLTVVGLRLTRDDGPVSSGR